jgi:AcrR family transcriptional regulator
MRADARRNRERILAAACDVFVELGSGAPLDEVARRAGVGIATLYRRFPDRQSLIDATVIDVLTRTAHEARLALAEEPDGFRALARYMHRAIDLRISAVIPALLGAISFEADEFVRARRESVEPFQAIIDAAHSEGTLRADVTSADIGLMVVRLSRALPGEFPRDTDISLAHRHLDIVIDGLRAPANGPRSSLSGPALALTDLQSMAPAGPNVPPPAPVKDSDSD